MSKTIGVPSVSGVGTAFKNFGWGAIGGLIFLLAYRMFGGLGILAAPLLAGSIMKGEKGQMISSMSGFLLVALGALGGGMATGNGANSTSQEVM